MSTYAVGDLQGCFREFQQLLELIRFDPARDKLWLVGDLVNRGPDLLAVLRHVKSLGDAAITVLGNHDLHLLAVAAGVAELHRSDTISDILHAPDREELLTWLRGQRLLHTEGNFVLVHAGLLPEWTAPQAAALAREVETALHGKHYHEFLTRMYGNTPDRWSEDLTGYKRLRVITNACTRMRITTENGEMEFKFKGVVEDCPEGYMPWFEVPHRASRDAVVISGHWSALGLIVRDDVIALDTGCLWGGTLTAIRLEDRKTFQVPCTNCKTDKPWVLAHGNSSE